MWLRRLLIVTVLAMVTPLSFGSAGNRVTILYDAFGETTALTKDWGFAALVEYRGLRILFDTGNNPQVFAHNAAAAEVDLALLDSQLFRTGISTTRPACLICWRSIPASEYMCAKRSSAASAVHYRQIFIANRK